MLVVLTFIPWTIVAVAAQQVIFSHQFGHAAATTVPRMVKIQAGTFDLGTMRRSMEVLVVNQLRLLADRVATLMRGLCRLAFQWSHSSSLQQR